MRPALVRSSFALATSSHGKPPRQRLLYHNLRHNAHNMHPQDSRCGDLMHFNLGATTWD